MESNKKYHMVVCGGTFDHFHKGHKDFLRVVLSSAEKCIIGITTDEFVRKLKNHEVIEPYHIRKESVLGFTKENRREERAVVIPIVDLYGPTLEKDLLIDLIVVSDATENGARIINNERKRCGMPVLDVQTIPMATGEDGEHISSSRIREGIIDRNGRLTINSRWRSQILFITEELRSLLGRPFGSIIKDIALWTREHDPAKVIAVGDVTTKTFNELNFGQVVSVVDFHIARQKIHSHVKDVGFEEAVEVVVIENAAGTLTPSLFENVDNLFQTQLKEQVVFQVLGEEDLSVLPFLLRAPLGFSVVYGQPGSGVVEIEITESAKDRAYDIVNSFSFAP